MPAPAHPDPHPSPESLGPSCSCYPAPGGGDVPKGTEVSQAILSPAGSCMTSTAPRCCREFRAGARPAPGTDTSALVGRTERGSLVRSPSSSSNCCFSRRAPLRLVQVRGAGEARAWQRGHRSRHRRARGRSAGCLQERRPGHLAAALSSGQVLSSLSQGSRARGLPPFPRGHFLSSPEGHGVVLPGVPHKDGPCLSRLQPVPRKGPRLWS